MHSFKTVPFNGLYWAAVHPNATFDMLGYIPAFLNTSDPEPAAKQINKNYLHGGGWHPFPNFTLLDDGKLKYPGDPPIAPLFYTKLRDEEIIFYQHSWMLIKQPDGKWEVCRLD